MKARPNIFTYHDYSHFLNDWVKYLKASEREFSLRRLSTRAGISPAYLSLILSGRRNLPVGAAKKMSKKMSLRVREQRYFNLLVKMSESGDQSDRQAAYQQMKRFGEYQETNKKEVEVHRYMSKWFYVAIRELVAHPEFKGDLKWLQKRLIKHVPLAEIKEAIRFLEQNNFIQKKSAGGYLLPTKNVDCLGGIYQLSLNQFHRQVLAMASDSIDTISKERRHLSGYTFMMAEESYLKLIDVLNNTQDKIRSIEEEDQLKQGKKAVYHVEFVAMPLTRGEK